MQKDEGNEGSNSGAKFDHLLNIFHKYNNIFFILLIALKIIYFFYSIKSTLNVIPFASL
jgi:hypothetical protein